MTEIEFKKTFARLIKEEIDKKTQRIREERKRANREKQQLKISLIQIKKRKREMKNELKEQKKINETLLKLLANR